ncbi:xanthine dioxygenase, partial [Phenoliferia sp. Uapishka_3]
MAIELQLPLKVSPLRYPASCSPSLKEDGFGVVVEGVKDINNISEAEMAQIEKLLYTHSLVLFPNVDLTPKGQFQLTNAFDKDSHEYGHGAVGRPEAASILHPDLRNIPSQPAVQLIGNGPISDENITQGLLIPCQLKHPSHQHFHKTIITDEDSAAGFTRFYRWHIDAALYERDPPKVTTLYGLKMPSGGHRQTVRYDDGTNDELDVSIGATAFVSGKKMFEILPPAYRSLAVRTKVQYSPHPYVWMATAKSNSTGLGMVSDGMETAREDLPPFEVSKIKTYPMVFTRCYFIFPKTLFTESSSSLSFLQLWKNPVTGALHFQVHPSGVQTLVHTFRFLVSDFTHHKSCRQIIDPLPAGAVVTKDTLYPAGAHLTDLKEVRDLLYKMQRPAIAPEVVLPASLLTTRLLTHISVFAAGLRPRLES